MARGDRLVSAASANLWPGMTLETAQQFSRIGAGLPISQPNKFAQVHVRYYHQVNVAASGVTQLSFFNVGQQEHISNLNNGLAPDERPFWLTGICFTPQDLTTAGAINNEFYTAAAQGANQLNAHLNYVRAILQGGLFQLFIGDRKILDVQDLTHFPADGGFSPVVAATLTSTHSMGGPQNGQPIAGNRFRLPAPYPVLPGKQILGIVKWQSAISTTAAANAFRLKCELVGESVLPLSV
jgi:hypothetical protein